MLFSRFYIADYGSLLLRFSALWAIFRVFFWFWSAPVEHFFADFSINFRLFSSNEISFKIVFLRLHEKNLHSGDALGDHFSIDFESFFNAFLTHFGALFGVLRGAPGASRTHPKQSRKTLPKPSPSHGPDRPGRRKTIQFLTGSAGRAGPDRFLLTLNRCCS